MKNEMTIQKRAKNYWNNIWTILQNSESGNTLDDKNINFKELNCTINQSETYLKPYYGSFWRMLFEVVNVDQMVAILGLMILQFAQEYFTRPVT